MQFFQPLKGETRACPDLVETKISDKLYVPERRALPLPSSRSAARPPLTHSAEDLFFTTDTYPSRNAAAPL